MSRKSEDFSGRLKAYESGQHPHAISLAYLLVVHSKKGGLPFKRQKKTQLLYKKMWTQLLSYFRATIAVHFETFDRSIFRDRLF